MCQARQISLMGVLLLLLFPIGSFADPKISDSNQVISLDFIFRQVGLSSDYLEKWVEKYKDYDEDYEKIINQTLFDPEPDRKVSKVFQTYNEVRTVTQAGRIADVLFKMRSKEDCSRIGIEYKNLYLFYYYRGSDHSDWIYVVALSRHTGEILISASKDNLRPDY